MRFSDASLAEMADRVLPSDGPTDGDPWFCVLAGRERREVRAKHTLFLGGTVVMRTSSSAHLVRALVRSLAAVRLADGAGDGDEGFLHLRLQGFVSDRGAVLVDPTLNGAFDRAPGAAARAGWSRMELAITTLDVAERQVVLPDVRDVGADPSALIRLGERGRGEPRLVAGRVPLLAIVTHPDGRDSERSARLLSRAGFAWAGNERGDVDRTAELVASVPLLPAGPGPEGLVGALRRSSRSPEARGTTADRVSEHN